MAHVSKEAMSLATKLAAQALKKNQQDIAVLKKTVTAQDAKLKEAKTMEKATKIAMALVLDENTVNEIMEKTASLLQEDLTVVEKAIDLGLGAGLKLGSVVKSTSSTASSTESNALIDFLIEHADKF